MRPAPPLTRLLLLVLLGAMTVAVPGLASAAPADDAPAYDAPVDLTFPVAGPVSFIDDYHQCRGGAGCPRYHRATDIMAAYGQTVHAAVGGHITFITGYDRDGNVVPPPSYGYMIRIAGDDGRTYNYVHLGDQDLGPEEAYARGMARGVRVERGQHIGFNGHSGNAHRDHPHLHFEIVDPAVTDPYGTDRMNPYASLVAARDRGDLPGTVAGPFRDVPHDHPHVEGIGWLRDAGFTNGCNGSGDRFCPSATITRQQLAALVVRVRGLTETSGKRFADVDDTSVFRDDIDRVATAGITLGCNPPANDRFCPTDTVTRMQAASFLDRAFALPAGEGTFVDVDDDNPHAEAIARLAAARITGGCNPPTNDRFCPTTAVTRAQFASFLHRGTHR